MEMNMAYAGFWRRLGAYLLDSLIMLPLIGLLTWLGGTSRLFDLYYFLPGLLFGLWFHVYLVKRYGGTPGKLILKIRIAKLDGTPVGYREAAIRHSVLFVLTTLMSIAIIVASFKMSDSEFYSLGFQARNMRLLEYAPPWNGTINVLFHIWIWSEFIVMLTNKKRRAAHDFMAGTVVVGEVTD